LNDLAPAKKKRRRRNRRRGSGGQAGAAAVQSFIPAAQVENRPGAHPDPYDRAAEAAGIAAERKAHEQRLQSADELAALLLPLITQERHKQVFDWVCAASGVGPAVYMQQIVRAEIARQTPAFREARGGGGKSSRNIEALTERLPVHR